MSSFEFRKQIKVPPRSVRDGGVSFMIPAALMEKQDEIAMSIQFISDRMLFGLAYSGVQGDYFDGMPPKSGVLIHPLVPTGSIAKGASRPGDIDLLIVPYENDDLILHRAVAMEIKALRVRHLRKGKSPNQFGFSQASSLLELGFPYVVVTHLIVSDESPVEDWREVMVAQKLDQDGNVKMLPPEKIDLMPWELMNRGLGRLKRNCSIPELGLICAYLDWSNTLGKRRVWYPQCHPASLNPRVSMQLLDAVSEFYHANASMFLESPRYDLPKVESGVNSQRA